jgi:hypothetical protein
MTRTKQFEHDGRTYEVRAEPFPEGWRVRVFVGGRRATPVTYTVAHEVAIDASHSWVGDLVDGLMETAEHDIRRGYVKELITAERSSRKSGS